MSVVVIKNTLGIPYLIASKLEMHGFHDISRLFDHLIMHDVQKYKVNMALQLLAEDTKDRVSSLYSSIPSGSVSSGIQLFHSVI